MKKHFLALAAIAMATLGLHAQNVATETIQKEVNDRLSNLPFATFQITVPSFGDKVVNIKDKGAIGNGISDASAAIDEAIKEVSESGGGTVLIPAGLWVCGPITMMSNVNLHFAEGAFLEFTGDKSKYTLSKSGSGFRMNALINGKNLKNIAITGKGIINGNGGTWRFVKKEKLTEKQWKAMTKTGEISADGKRWSPNIGYFAAEEKQKSLKGAPEEEWNKVKMSLRPYLLNVGDVDNMLVEGVTFMNSPHITVKLDRINGLVMKDVKVYNEWWYQNSDGLDISASKNVLMYDCTVNTGDDGICMKSSRGNGSAPFLLQNIVIQDCKVMHAHGGFVIGSNTDGGMKNIYVKNCSFSLTETGLRFKSGTGRGGRVQDVYCEDIFMKDMENEAIIFELTYEDKGAIVKANESQALTPDFDGISIKNVFCDGAKTAITLGGTPTLNVKNVTFQNVVIKARSGVDAFRSEGITFDNVNIIPEVGPAFKLNKATNITFKNMPASVKTGTYAKIFSAETKNITFEKGKLQPSQIEILNGADPSQVKY